jgi:hypothetical protein
MAKSSLGKVLTLARTVKSTIGLVEFFNKKFNSLTTKKDEEDYRLSDSYAGNSLLTFPIKLQDTLWSKYHVLEDSNRKHRILDAWIAYSEAKLPEIQLRIPKSNKNWKNQNQLWQNFIVKCREEKNKLS